MYYLVVGREASVAHQLHVWVEAARCAAWWTTDFMPIYDLGHSVPLTGRPARRSAYANLPEWAIWWAGIKTAVTPQVIDASRADAL